MNTRIQQALDGELARARLRPDELAELEAYEEAMDGALAPLRGEPFPDLSAAIMRRVRDLPPHGRRPAGPPIWERARDWLLTPRPVQLRPAWVLAAATLAALLIVGPWAVGGGSPVDTAARAAVDAPILAGAGAAPVVVRFTLEAPDARRVHLAGDFTDWRPDIALSRGTGGVWTVEVPVRPGVHQYSFVVDGTRWTPDPGAPIVEDGFGGTNSRLDVLTAAEDRAL